MSEISIISGMFEELKQILKRIESNSTKPESAVTQDAISKPDLVNITNQVSQTKEVIIQKLNQIEQAQIAPKRLHHRISVDIKSSWVSFVLVGLFLFLVTLLCLCYKMNQTNNKLVDNDLKYRYVKAFNKTDTISIHNLEDVFDYNRDSQAIKKIRASVEQYEQDVIDRAKRMEQAKLKEDEARRLQDEASKLKSK